MSNLDEALAEMSRRGWLAHNLYQMDGKWVARLKVNDFDYRHGTGATLAEAIESAFTYNRAEQVKRTFPSPIASKPRQLTAQQLLDTL